MRTSSALTLLCTALAVVSWAAPARADYQDANCEVRKDGDRQKGKSGSCSFSQHQGNISLDLRNGDTYNLQPAGQPDRFRDQKGNKVVRSYAGGNTQEFKWEGGKKVIVTFSGNHNGNHNGYGASGRSSEYQRGYDDARRGYYDQNKHSQEYKDGHRAGEESRGGGAYGNGNYGNGNGKHNGSGEYFINRLDHGGIEVVWPKSQCYAAFDKHGNSTSYSDGCSSSQRSRSQEIARSER